MKYSIGDIVKVVDYGNRVADQGITGNAFKSKLTLPLNLDNKFTNTSYTICNEEYANQEWKIIDIIEVFTGTMFRLRTRNREDMLLLCSVGGLHLVRKGKKHE
jgi:hypothetical protein